jgi:hypothetical protein
LTQEQRCADLRSLVSEMEAGAMDLFLSIFIAVFDVIIFVAALAGLIFLTLRMIRRY